MLEPERGRHVVEIGHIAHVDPGLRHGDGDIGEAEAELIDEHHRTVGIGDHLAYQILAGDAEMHGAERELGRDFRRREVSDFHAVKAGDGAAIVAGAARLDQLEIPVAQLSVDELVQRERQHRPRVPQEDWIA